MVGVVGVGALIGGPDDRDPLGVEVTGPLRDAIDHDVGARLRDVRERRHPRVVEHEVDLVGNSDRAAAASTLATIGNCSQSTSSIAISPGASASEVSPGASSVVGGDVDSTVVSGTSAGGSIVVSTGGCGLDAGASDAPSSPLPQALTAATTRPASTSTRLMVMISPFVDTSIRRRCCSAVADCIRPVDFSTLGACGSAYSGRSR